MLGARNSAAAAAQIGQSKHHPHRWGEVEDVVAGGRRTMRQCWYKTAPLLKLDNPNIVLVVAGGRRTEVGIDGDGNGNVSGTIMTMNNNEGRAV